MPADGRWDLTLILLTWRIWWAPNNASRWQMGFNSAVKGLTVRTYTACSSSTVTMAVRTRLIVTLYVHWLCCDCQFLGRPWLVLSQGAALAWSAWWLDTYLLIAYLLTYLLTPRCRVLLEKRTGSQLVKKFPAFHETRTFITALKSARQLSLSWTSSIQSIYPHPTSWRSIFIFSSHLRLGLPSGPLSLRCLHQNCLYVSPPPIRATCTTHLIHLDFITWTILGEQYRSFGSSLCGFIMVTGLRVGKSRNPDLIPAHDKRFFCSAKRGVHLAFYSVCTGGCYPGGRHSENETDRLSHSSAKIKNKRNCTCTSFPCTETPFPWPFPSCEFFSL